MSAANPTMHRSTSTDVRLMASRTMLTRALVLPLLLSACVSAPTTAPPATARWAESCYTRFDADISALAGPDAIDCGFLRLDDPIEARIATRACARHAVKSGRSFKFGYGGIGTDSAYCEVAVRNGEGTLTSFTFDYDVTGRMGTDGSHSAIWTSTCEGIQVKPVRHVPEAFFEMRSCVSDDADGN